MRPLWVLGAGGHAKSVIDAAQSMGEYEVVGLLDDAYSEPGLFVMGAPILGRICPENIQQFAITNAVIAIGNNGVRRRVSEDLKGVVSFPTIVHRATYVAPSAVLGIGTVICAGAVIQPEARLGAHVIANTSSSVGHDCQIDDYAHVAPGTNIAGGVVVEQGAFLGIGSRVIPLRRIGAWATVGAGAAVYRDVPAGATVVGVPAEIVKPNVET